MIGILLDSCRYRDYDIHGPAGPTAFWKFSDDIAGRKEIDNSDEESVFDA